MVALTHTERLTATLQRSDGDVTNGHRTAIFALSPFTSVADLATGTILSIGTLLTCGQIHELNAQAHRFSNEGGAFFSNGHRELATFFIWGSPEMSFVVEQYQGGAPVRLLSARLRSLIIKTCANHMSGTLEDHLISRSVALVGTVALVCARVVDFVFGIFSSILTIFLPRKFYGSTYEGLKITSVVHDVLMGLTLGINPAAKVWEVPTEG